MRPGRSTPAFSDAICRRLVPSSRVWSWLIGVITETSGSVAFVASYAGCYANIVGLPLCHTFFALRRAGVAMPERPEPAFTRAFGFVCPAWRTAYAQGRQLRDGAEYATAPYPLLATPT